ncbi:MAG: proline dehydrogenase [Acidobacteria bacterium]|nr:MAG: proline dehydrogenase [Acidobacteriota bacterium]
MLRSVMLRLASNRLLLHSVNKVGNRYGFAKRFVAGETMGEAMKVVRDFAERGILASVDVLGEGVRDEEEARKAAQSYMELLDCLAANQLNAYISIKLTQLGLDISREACSSNLELILQKAKALGNFVRIDMESSRYTEITVRIFEEHLRDYLEHVGIVIQSYLYRSEADVRRLSASGCNIRLCKGAYKEPANVAFPKKRDVDRNYIKLLELLLSSPAYTAIATHDSRMINHARRFVADHKVPAEKYEFQMLYGVRREYQLEIARQGYKMRVYVPYGRHWAPYYMRRLAERPANVLFIAKNMLRK